MPLVPEESEAIIMLSGGVVSAVHIPKGFSIVLRDYDIEGVIRDDLMDGEEILTDEDGDEYMEVILFD